MVSQQTPAGTPGGRSSIFEDDGGDPEPLAASITGPGWAVQEAVETRPLPGIAAGDRRGGNGMARLEESAGD